MQVANSKLDLKGLRDLRRRLKGAESSQIEVGHIIQKWRKDVALYQAEIAIIQHEGVRSGDKMGAYRIPPRPYLKEAFKVVEKDSHFWRQVGAAVLTGKINNSKATLSTILRKYGSKTRDMIKARIKSDALNLIRNKPSTMIRKGSTVPLVDTQDLANDIRYRIASRRSR